ncbi:hypothetical protein N4P33_08990 [Streptomyces sp. 15-116A]|uniref:hypothetical protein n=1 Tax=Streptomyces sp. 15-116A TaxID=2259035 RepID=UPI0021B47F76|nr:hypothetical protein [Streptomyces sp. 15-116A]MCT7352310.1 hypothetical protein [Streptomyces sp. 15-116A]
MPRLTRGLAVAALTAVVCGIGTQQAMAGDFSEAGAQQAKPSGGTSGPLLESRVEFRVDGQSKSDDGGPITSTSVDWDPPACWYEPYWKAEDFKTFMEAQWSIYESAGGEPEGIADDKARYQKGHPYKDFNADKNDKGMWWVAVKNPEMKGDPAAETCNRDPFWVNNGENPDVPQAIDTETLAGLAYQRTIVPETEISTAPDGRSTVNLPTWIWLDKAAFKPVSATATLPGTGLWATTTAKPVSLHIDPGTEDAQTFPASGECRINADGSIGEPYAKGRADKTPPCGVSYLRSSAGDSYPLKATLTWEITWEGSGGTGGDLPNGTFATTVDVPVQEIQSVNR